MTEKLAKEVHYSLGSHTQDTGLVRIGLPAIQRRFVGADANVRELCDSMYREYRKLARGGA
jgi:hypothetical protein